MTTRFPKLKWVVLAASAALALLGTSSGASADAVTVFDVSPNLIGAGEHSTLSLTLNLTVDSPITSTNGLATYTSALFTGANGIFFSGDGQFGIANGIGNTVIELSQAFTYLTPGTYLTSFEGTYSYFRTGTLCGVRACSPIAETVTRPLSIEASLTVTEVAPVPLPTALPLFAGGLGLLGWMARRKRRHSEGTIAI